MAKKLSNIILYSGCLILMVSLIYMIVNLNKADHFISIWLPIIASGVILVFFSQIIKPSSRVIRKDK